MHKKNVIVIGAGFSGLSAACHLAKKGYTVKVIEKNKKAGGRASTFSANGFSFDMGPSWYWMPEVFEKFFKQFGKSVSDYYELVRLDPGYKIYFSNDNEVNIPASLENLYQLFEKLEPGSSINLKRFLDEAAYKYNVGMHEFVYKPSLSVKEYVDPRLIKSVFKLDMLTSTEKYVNRLFKNPYLRELLKFPVLFLGGTPKSIPAMYSLMNYADLVQGTWYPMGGMYKVIEGMVAVAKALGVTFYFNETVTEMNNEGELLKEVVTDKSKYEADIVVSAADYHHIDQEILSKENRNYSSKYWDKRTMAPSSLLFFVGLNKKVAPLLHHNLFFDTDFEQHAHEIYHNPKWPTNPLFYVCCPSKTDASVAPEGHENLFILMPIAPGLEKDDEEIRSKYFDIIIERIETITMTTIRENIVYKSSFGVSDFKSRYNSFKGNAYGLANTLKQTAILKPKLKSKKLDNLFYAGQLTVPGPGVPPSIISGEIVAHQIAKEFKI